MTPLETVHLCRLVKAACPAQAIDDYTPDIWQPILHDVALADAQTALIELARVKHFVDPADIYAEVRRIRRKRLENHGDPIPPDLGDVKAEVAWLRDARGRIAAGEHIPGRGVHHQLTTGPHRSGAMATLTEAVNAVRGQVQPHHPTDQENQ